MIDKIKEILTAILDWYKDWANDEGWLTLWFNDLIARIADLFGSDDTDDAGVEEEPSEVPSGDE